ncbi:hypothetical protein [Candidatus Regiella insecticola]|uniref:Uncharacterized protein n=1 Tax=Candidatus Regiella insecticola TaxID=138073 RepID=A0A6L2ZQ57_9ENTR|nr:hypothetical protein [Candidatus Regiella insecticola]GFN46381.1 hypothetical protein RINTU1_19460 [Candidatus Regiella insecticola]
MPWLEYVSEEVKKKKDISNNELLKKISAEINKQEQNRDLLTVNSKAFIEDAVSSALPALYSIVMKF